MGFSGPRNAWVWEKDFDESASWRELCAHRRVDANGRFMGNTVCDDFLRNLKHFCTEAQDLGELHVLCLFFRTPD